MREFNIGTLFFNLIYIMKRFFVLAALVLGLAACQTEPEGLDVNVGGEVDTTITVSLPETTRANSAVGAFENLVSSPDYTIRYIFQVFYNGTESQAARQVIYTDNEVVSFPVRLVPGRHYNFVVWADVTTTAGKTLDTIHNLTIAEAAAADIHYNTEDLKSVTIIDNSWVAMDETRDAFTGHFDTAVDGNGEKYSSASSINFTLTRPFAKLRVITTDMEQLNDLRIIPTRATVEYTTQHYASFNAFAGGVNETDKMSKTHTNFEIKAYDDNVDDKSKVLFTDYFFAKDQQDVVNFTLTVYDQRCTEQDVQPDYIIKSNDFNTPIPAHRNNLTTISGNILTDSNNVTVTVEDAFDGYINNDVDKDEISTTVNTAQDFAAALTDDDIDVIVLNGDINLDDLLATRAATINNGKITIDNGKTLTIDLNGNMLSANTYENSGNQELFLVKGTLTVKNGTIEYKHLGENMGWGSMTTIFNVTAGGVLNLEGVTATNKGGSDMGFVAHLNNWGEVTLNVENCTLESNYVPVRVFNSGNDMNNVTIKNSTLKGVSAAFWVHNYTAADFGSEAKAEAQKALLNLNIYNQGNTFTPDVNGIRYGFTNSVRADAYGITKGVSEDGTEVILGSMTNDGLVRRGVAGEEENTTIKKAVVGEGITTLYDRTFRRFYALEEVVLPSTLTTIGAAGSGVFQSCTALKSIVIPESVTVLGKGSFQECSSLESINIPAGVTRIEADALRATGLVSVEFHEGVTYFGAQAFRDCKQLKEVIINAPEFTVEANAFGVTSGALPGTTIYVANAEMKAYLESTLAYKNQFTIVAPNSVASKEDLPVENGKLDTNFEEDVNLYGDITVSANETNANSGYGATGVTVTNGAVLNGQGHKLTVNNAWDTWDCVVAAKGGTIKNLTVSSAMRGIFMPGANGDVYIDNVIFDNVIYTFNSDAGNKNYGVYISNSTLNGWTSHSDVHKEVIYTNCKFGKGNGYATCRPYGPTSFVGCNFEAGFQVEAIGKITFENCTIGGVALTADNLATLVTYNTANATVIK